MNILSLFDGMSCGQIALRELGIKVDKYFASEIDKHAMAQTQLNFPQTIQLGSVTEVKATDLPPIDLLIGGSPCQSFSFAGKRAGMSTKQKEEIYTLDRYLELKQAGFEFEGQSYLFWEYVRILQELRESNPNVLFLLENVEMGKKWERVLSEAIGLQGVHINSALVSAQIRKRIYWTNIRTGKTLLGELYTAIPQPKDRGILLRDILEDDADVDEKLYLKAQTVQNLIAHKLRNKAAGRNYGAVFHAEGGKMHALKVGGKGVDDLIARAMKTETLCARAGEDGNGQASIKINDCEQRIRRLTPTECARLQTIPEWYKWKCSNAQQYKMLGNGWTVDVIKHIFKYINQ